MPTLSDYLTIEEVEKAMADLPQSPRLERQFDEKFHTLQAPLLFLPDLAYYRDRCGQRRVPLLVGYIDIDNFKKFNTKYTEPVVDRDLLPKFMASLEAHTFSHGHAYRYGGDEYVLIIPNMSLRVGTTFIEDYRQTLQKLRFVGIEEPITLSIGLCEIHADLPLTEREIEERANVAKNFAKDQGKDRVATYGNEQLLHGDLRILLPAG
jgi:diguanylate cyclase (GGDEF)-like protein